MTDGSQQKTNNKSITVQGLPKQTAQNNASQALAVQDTSEAPKMTSSQSSLKDQ